MKTTDLRFQVLEVNKTSDGQRYYAKLFCKFTEHEGTLGKLSQKVERQLTYYYPMQKLGEGVKLGKQENEFVTIPHKEFAGRLHPVGFTVKHNVFDADGTEIETKWLFHADTVDA